MCLPPKKKRLCWLLNFDDVADIWLRSSSVTTTVTLTLVNLQNQRWWQHQSHTSSLISSSSISISSLTPSLPPSLHSATPSSSSSCCFDVVFHMAAAVSTNQLFCLMKRSRILRPSLAILGHFSTLFISSSLSPPLFHIGFCHFLPVSTDYSNVPPALPPFSRNPSADPVQDGAEPQETS